MKTICLTLALLTLTLAAAGCSGHPLPAKDVGQTSATLRGDARVDSGDGVVSWWWQLARAPNKIGPADPNGATSKCRSGPATPPVGNYHDLSCRVTGLTPGRGYYYRFCGATSKVKPTCSSEIQDFSTKPAEGTYGDPSEKLATQARYADDVASFVAASSPRPVPGMDTSGSRTASMLQQEWDDSFLHDLATDERLHQEVSSLLFAVKVFNYARLAGVACPEIPISCASAAITGLRWGIKIEGKFYDLYMDDDPPPPVTDNSKMATNARWVQPGNILLSAGFREGVKDALAPNWGLVLYANDRTSGYEYHGSCVNDVEGLYGPAQQLTISGTFNMCNGEGADAILWVLFQPTTLRPCGQGTGRACVSEEFTDYDLSGQGPVPSADDFRTDVQAQLSTDQYPVLNHWLNNQLDPQAQPTNPIAKADPLREALGDPRTKIGGGKTVDQVMAECVKPVFYYTDAATAATIYSQRRIQAAPNSGLPPGAYASTLGPVAAGWTQRRLSNHLLKDPQRSAASWVMLCADQEPFFQHTVPGAQLGWPDPRKSEATGQGDYWYSPRAAGDSIPVNPVATGVTLVPYS